MQLCQATETVFQDAMVRGIARVRSMKQRHVSRLAHQNAEADDAQVRALALGVPTSCQLSRGHCGDVRVEICRIEREDVCSELESRHGGARQFKLGTLQLPFLGAHGQSMKLLSRERVRGKTRDTRNRPVEERAEMTLGRGRARSLHRHGKHHFPQRHALWPSAPPASAVDHPDDVQLLRRPDKRTDVANTESAHGPRVRQFHLRWRVRRTENDLPRVGAADPRVPHRLRSDTVATLAH